MDKTIRGKLIDLAEEEYRKFSAGLILNVDKILGVRLPLLRKLAREISKGVWGDWRGYLDDTLGIHDTMKPQNILEPRAAKEPQNILEPRVAKEPHDVPELWDAGEKCGNDAFGEYFEEIMLQGMVIGYAKADADEKLRLVARFVPKIGNWSVCDSFCSNLKFVKDNKQRVWNFIQPYPASDKEFEVRFGVNMLLYYYIDEEHIEQVLQLLDKVRHEGYYAKMAVAWAVSMCYVRLSFPTMQYLKNNSLDDFTYNKALQKIIESHQVDNKTKDLIRSMKRK